MFLGLIIIAVPIVAMIIMVVILSVLRSQGGHPVAVPVITAILSLLAIFLIVVAGSAIYKSAKEGPLPPGMPYNHRAPPCGVC